MQFILKSVKTPHRYTAIDTISRTCSNSSCSTSQEALANVHRVAFVNSDFFDITDIDILIKRLKTYSSYTLDSYGPTIDTYEFW